ncbi:hypothetical protein Ga0466249_000399 [Sporomusaceae bacterium BoRhaA]|nr:hypothetical protein [Pelorhabdus rhamnosifermentans]
MADARNFDWLIPKLCGKRLTFFAKISAEIYSIDEDPENIFLRKSYFALIMVNNIALYCKKEQHYN